MSESEEICIFQDILDTCKDGPVVKISDTRLESVEGELRRKKSY